MSKEKYTGPERRQFMRLPYRSPLKYKVCKEETIDKLMQGYTEDISNSGLLCNIEEDVPVDSVLWLLLDNGALDMCAEIEKRSVILQHGVLGKVVRTYHKRNGTYDVGVRFLVREESSEAELFKRLYVDEEMLGSNEDK